MAGNPVASYAAPTVVTDGATQTFDCLNAAQFVWTLGANRTVSTFANPPGGARITLTVTQDATGSRLLTWPSNVRWPAATAPTLTITAAKSDIFNFHYNATTNVWDASTVGLNYT